MRISDSSRSSSNEIVFPANRWPGGHARTTSSRKSGSNTTRAVTAREADDAELERAVGDELDDAMRVRNRQRDAQLRVRLRELGEDEGHDGAARPGGRAELEAARDPLALGQLVEELLLGGEHALRVPVEALPGLGRLDAAAGAVERAARRAASRAPGSAG